jgi:thioester reductase-like protein
MMALKYFCKFTVKFFIALGTGFMGKVFVEKLLRITKFEKLYLLMRAKKGKNPKDRLVDMFANPVSVENFVGFSKANNY